MTPMIIQVDTSVLTAGYAETYFTERADRRIMIGLRATLEMLGIPLPDWAERKPTGRKPGKAIAAAFRADNPETLHEATMRRVAEHTARLPTKACAAASTDPLALAWEQDQAAGRQIDTSFLG